VRLWKIPPVKQPPFIVYRTLSVDGVLCVCVRAYTYCILFHHLLRHCSYSDCNSFIVFGQNVSSVVSGYTLLCGMPYSVGMTCYLLGQVVSIALFCDMRYGVCVCVCVRALLKLLNGWKYFKKYWRPLHGWVGYTSASLRKGLPLIQGHFMWDLCGICGRQNKQCNRFVFMHLVFILAPMIRTYSLIHHSNWRHCYITKSNLT
jgi:hypothetical protein